MPDRGVPWTIADLTRRVGPINRPVRPASRFAMSAAKILPTHEQRALRLRRRARRSPERLGEENDLLDLRLPTLIGAGPGLAAPAGMPLARSLGPNAVLALQRTHGNHHVQRLLTGAKVQRCGGNTACGCAACGGGEERERESARVAPQRIQRQSGGGQPMLRLGSKSPAVAALQQQLGITADGIFGPATHKAVVAFQQNAGLTPDGIVGPKTWASLSAGPGAGQTGGPGAAEPGTAAAVQGIVAKLGAVRMAFQALKSQTGDTADGATVVPGTAAPTIEPQPQPGWLDDAADWVGDKAESAAEWAGDAAETVVDTATSAGEWVGDTVESAGEWANEQVDSATNWATEQATAAGEWVGEQAGAASDWVGEQVGAASDWVSEQVDAAGEAVGSAVEAATEVATGVWDEVQAFGDDLRQRYAKELAVLESVVRTLGQPLVGLTPGILATLGQQLDALLGQLGGAALGAHGATDAEELQSPPATNQKSYTTVTVTNASYSLSGTLSEVGQKLADKGHAGSVTPKWKKTYTEHDTATKKTVLAQFEVELVKTMPTWADYAKQCDPIKAEWDRVYAGLDAHENKHVADDKGIFGQAHTKVLGIPDDKVSDVLDGITTASDAASDAFHATPAGSSQPTVKYVTCGGLQKVP